MRDSIKWVANRMPKSDDRQLSIMSLGNVAKARFFHSSFPQYSITPLARLDGMAKYLGLGGLLAELQEGSLPEWLTIGQLARIAVILIIKRSLPIRIGFISWGF